MTVPPPAPAPAEAIERIVVIHDFPSPEGGAGMLAVLSARQYRERGIPVTFFSGALDLAGEEMAGIDCVGLRSKPLLQLSTAAAMRQGLHNGEARDALRDWIAANDSARTVYHLHNWSQILSPAIFEALRPVESRLVVTCHDFFNVCPNGSFTNFPKSEPCSLRPLSVACISSRCDRRSWLHKAWRVTRQAHLGRIARFSRSLASFTFIHEQMRERFVAAGFGAHDLVTLPNPVEPWSAERIAAETNARFLFVGRVGRDKGADLAAQAALDADVPLTLLGTGELEEAIGAMGGQLQLGGWCDRAELLEHARKARAVVVPSRVTEPFGLVILEAAASGLPVIVSDRAYMAGDVTRQGFGESFNPAKAGELAGIMKRLAEDDTAIARMSRAGMAASATLALSPHEWSERLLALFLSKLGHSGEANSRQADCVPAGARAIA